MSFFPEKKVNEEQVTIDIVTIPTSVAENKEFPQNKVDSNKMKQIVEQNEEALNKEESKNAKYYSKNTQSVTKETTTKNRGEFRNSRDTMTARTSVTQPHTKSSQVKKQQNQAISDPTLTTKNSGIGLKTEKFDPFAESSKNFKARSLETMMGTTPSNSFASGMASQTQDYLKNTELGVETVLNTKEFKYYTYFNRIRRQLSLHWEPKVREKLTNMFRKGRSIASDQDRITKLLIYLNPNGVLVKVQVLSDSGVRDLDEAAIEAFKSAAPFPNPPRGIVDTDGTVKIRWDFILES
ncbi:MAG: energy transducer TonB [Bdellovibrionaceae bacterium]|nr:energy transducer TonB [Pseudobdellovibrionaceae bacterium]NUM57351.1 energy transducer TonB [Pseudobdellovibrionaceae bacterium]